MTLPATPLSASDINTEFGASNGTAVSLNAQRVRLLGGAYNANGDALLGTSYSTLGFGFQDLQYGSRYKNSTTIRFLTAANRSIAPTSNTSWYTGDGITWNVAYIGDFVSDSLDIAFDCTGHYMSSNWYGLNATVYLALTGNNYDYYSSNFISSLIPFGNPWGPNVGGPYPFSNYGNNIQGNFYVPAGYTNINLSTTYYNTFAFWGWPLYKWMSTPSTTGEVFMLSLIMNGTMGGASGGGLVSINLNNSYIVLSADVASMPA